MHTARGSSAERQAGDAPKKTFATVLRSISSGALATRIASSKPAKAFCRATKSLPTLTAVRSKFSRKANKAQEHNVPLEEQCLMELIGTIESGSCRVSISDPPTPPPSNPDCRTDSAVSTISGTSYETADYIPLRRYPRVRGYSDPVSTTPSTPQVSTTSQTKPHREHDIVLRPRARTYSGLEERKDPKAYFAGILSDLTTYFALNSATTTDQRRAHLHILSHDHYYRCAIWLAAHPEDLWDSEAERDAGRSHVMADTGAEMLESSSAGTSFWDVAPRKMETEEEKVRLRERASEVGWTQARQETVFAQEWVTGTGRWGVGKGVEVAKGPSGEVV